MSAPDPFLLEACRKARTRCAQIAEVGSGDLSSLAGVMDVLLFAEERSAIERSEMLNQTRDIPLRMSQLEKRFDDFENGTVGDVRRGLADALTRIGLMETARATEQATKLATEKTTDRWAKILKTALIITWTGIITGASLFGFFYKAVPRELPSVHGAP